MTRLHDVVSAAARALLVIVAPGALVVALGALSALSTLATTTRVYAQAPTDALSPQQVSLACALPPATSTIRTGALHVVGAQDTIPRSLFSERDLLVVDGGAGRGVEVGQQYFVRRAVSSSVYSGSAKAIVTAGWIRIVAANQATAIATVERSCRAIEAGDYLDAFVAPVVPVAAMVIDRTGEPDFTTLGRVLFGEDERAAGGAGEYMVIDRGTEQGLAPGARFAIYRDVQGWMRDRNGAAPPALPLSSIGEGVVVTTGQTMSVMQILAARDAVQRGDYVVPRPNTR
jgi:hypothetical protein